MYIHIYTNIHAYIYIYKALRHAQVELEERRRQEERLARDLMEKSEEKTLMEEQFSRYNSTIYV